MLLLLLQPRIRSRLAEEGLANRIQSAIRASACAQGSFLATHDSSVEFLAWCGVLAEWDTAEGRERQGAGGVALCQRADKGYGCVYLD